MSEMTATSLVAAVATHTNLFPCACACMKNREFFGGKKG